MNRIDLSIGVTSGKLRGAGFTGNLKAAKRVCQAWLKSIIRNLTCASKCVLTVSFTEVPVGNVSFNWSITLEGDFYCDDIDELNTMLQRKYRQRFGNLGDNHVVVRKQQSHAT